MSSIERETIPDITSSSAVLIIYGQVDTRFQIAKKCAGAHTLFTTDSPHQALSLLTKRKQDRQPPPTHLLLNPADPFGLPPQEASPAQLPPPSCIGFRNRLLKERLITPDTVCIAIYHHNCPPGIIEQVKQAGFFTQKDPFTQAFETAAAKNRQPLRNHTTPSTKPEDTSLAALASSFYLLGQLVKTRKN